MQSKQTERAISRPAGAVVVPFGLVFLINVEKYAFIVSFSWWF